MPRFPESNTVLASASSTERMDGIYRDHGGWLKFWLERRIGCGEAALELTHDVFIALLKRGDTFHVEFPKAYLKSVAKGLAVDHVRRRSLERAYLKALSEAEPNVSPSEESRLIIVQTLIRIDEAFTGLPVRVKKVFVLSRIAQLKQKEIASRLRVSLRTVEKDLARAILHFHQTVNED